jgi:hypothetical protein
VINGTTNTLNTPDNLRRWNIADNVMCGLCGHKNATLKHVLAGCPWVFEVENKMKSEDRITWRHNCVLLVVARAIIAKVAQVNKSPNKTDSKPSQLQSFVKAGQQPRRSIKPTVPSILDKARDWVYNFDLPEFHHGKSNSLVFPYDVLITKQRIDGYIISRKKKICILGPEMTSPMDDNVLKWHTAKTAKYRLNTSEAEGWTFYDCSLETGALGWIPPTNRSILKSLGFTSAEVRLISDDMALIARRCSYVIYLNRFHQDFQHFRISPRSGKNAVKGEYFDTFRIIKPEPCTSLAISKKRETAPNRRLSKRTADLPDGRTAPYTQVQTQVTQPEPCTTLAMVKKREAALNKLLSKRTADLPDGRTAPYTQVQTQVTQPEPCTTLAMVKKREAALDIRLSKRLTDLSDGPTASYTQDQSYTEEQAQVTHSNALKIGIKFDDFGLPILKLPATNPLLDELIAMTKL